jgi:PAS domain S-box-containing protein
MLLRFHGTFAPSVQGKIVLLALAAVGVTALCSGIFIVQTRANIESQVFEDQAALGQTYARVVQQYLDGSRSVLEGLARVPAVRAPLHPELKRPELRGIPEDADPERRASVAGVIDGSRRVLSVLITAPNADVYMLQPYQKQLRFPFANLMEPGPDLFQRTVTRGEASWSDIILDGGTGLPSVVMLVPMRDDSGALVSVLGASLGLEGLTDAARNIQPGKTSSVMLFDRQGMPVVYPDTARISARQPLTELPLVRHALDGQTGSFAYHNPLNNQDELGTVVPLENGWFVMVTRTQAEAFDGLRQTITTLLGVLGVSVVILLAAGLFLARSIARALRVVARAADGLASGDLDQHVNVWSKDELGQMAGAFRDMMAYHQRMATIADAVAAGDLSAHVEPQSDRDRLGIALRGMVGNLRHLVTSLEERSTQAERAVAEMQVQITERHRAEEALRVRERALAAASSPVVVSDARMAGRPVIYANPAFERLSGYTEAEVLGRSLALLQGPDTDPAVAARFAAIASEGRSETNELVVYRKDGQSFWVEVAAAPVRTADGEVSHYVWVMSDTTERRATEKNAQALARADKLRALGQMASGIAHDLNQSLMLIASYGHLGGRALEHESLDRDELREMFTVVTQAAMDGGDTVKRLLQFARAPIEAATQPIDLTLLAREVAQLTAPRWRDAAQADGRPIKLEVETAGHPGILGAPAALREALTNLIMNAVDALPRGGTIRLRVLQSEDHAAIEVVDDGVGMPPEVQSRMFEPFFTTKGDKGTGLGLATVFGVVERLGGQVRVQSTPGEGTTFRLQFQAIAAMPERAEVPASKTRHAVLPQRQLRILAVDDEPALTKAVVRLLRPIGHVVTTASSGEEALERLAEDAFDVVLSDIGMGAGMNGWELAERVRHAWPDIRFALATGWGAAIDPAEARAKGIVAVLAKPYSAAELEQVLTAA